jgi:peptidoglycan/xylan/chitin deacetylase (PgdA/CDA1 family)
MNWIERKTLGILVKTKGVLSAPLFAGKGLVFMLHRVLPEKDRNQFTLNKDLAISPEKLEEFILFFKEKGYIFISLDTLENWLDNNLKLNKKFICLTFDDGYKDNLIHGLPILKKHQVPATIYITNCFPNGKAILWWYLFEEHVRYFNQLVINASIRRLEFYWKDQDDAFRQFGKVSEAIKAIPAQELHLVLCQSFGLSDSEITEQSKEVALSWDEIKVLSNEPLITIGAHTMNHLSLRQQSESTVIEEMKVSKLEIEAHIGQQVNHFAYPYGSSFDVSKRDLAITTSLGFKTSVLNQAGNIFKQNKKNKQALARMPLGNGTDNERMSNYLNGIYHFSNNQFSKTIKNLN